MNQSEMIKKLKGYIYSEFGTAKAYAKECGVSSNFISMVISGKKQAPDWILQGIKVKREVNIVYRDIAICDSHLQDDLLK